MADNNLYNNTFWGNLGEASGSLLSGVGASIKDAWDTGVEAYNAWAPKWGANTANAVVTGVFSALGSLSGVKTSKAIFDLYKRQEQEYINNAMEQARRIQLKGDIELRNLYIKHTKMQGKNELGVAASGGNLSGSFLDTLVEQHKYNMMDERTSSIQTLWDKDNAIRSGYIQSIGTAGKAMTYAYQNKSKSLEALTSMAKSISGALLKDKQQYDTVDAQRRMLLYNYQREFEWLEDYYGSPTNIASGTIVESEYDASNPAGGITSTFEDDPASVKTIPPNALPPFTLWPDINYSSERENEGLILDQNAVDSLLNFNA